jgi:hypothetical protein
MAGGEQAEPQAGGARRQQQAQQAETFTLGYVLGVY